MNPSLGHFFSESANKFPTRPALFAAGRYWSYSELDAECRRIERALHAAGKTGKHCNIGLVYARDAFSYAGIIAIMRSGNVYVPLNSRMPVERLFKIIEDAEIHTLIVDDSESLSEGVKGLLERSRSLQLIVKTGTSLQMFRHQLIVITTVADLPENVAPASLAYIIYTSGSTGVPKGVAISHESACGCIEKSHALFDTHEQDRFTQFSALSFDVSILDLFLCWKSGAALFVPAASEAMVPFKFVVTHRITVWSSVPSLANFLLKLQLLKQDSLSHIRLFLFCGEALPNELAHALVGAAPRARVVNLYGPTECTIYATCHEYDRACGERSGVVPIGLPLPRLHCMIVDDDRIVKMEDRPGELWLAGDQLAVEYWRNPLATQTAFVQFNSGVAPAGLWYRTGDLVSYRQGVGYSFRGRLDRQVKLRGFRIELQEVESALRKVIGCTLVAVVPLRSAGGICEKIIAYCDLLNADEATIKTRCLAYIPSYMIPDRVLELDSFPLSESGKINYLALAEKTATA